MNNKYHKKYYIFLITCYETVPLNKSGIVNGIIYFEKGCQCEELVINVYANQGVRFVELIPKKNYKMDEHLIAKEYSIHVGELNSHDVIRIKFSVSLSKFNDAASEYIDGYDRENNYFNVIHNLFTVKISYKIDGEFKKLSQCLSICRQITLFDDVKYSLKMAVDFSLKQQYIYAQCEIVKIIQKIKIFEIVGSKKLLVDLEKCHDSLMDTENINTFVHNAEQIILNFLELV